MRRRAILLAVLALSGATTLAACGGKGGGSGGGDSATQPTVGAKVVRRRARATSGSLRSPPRTRRGSAAATGSPTPRASRGPSIRRPSVKTRPKAVTLVDSRDWRVAVAATVLSGDPVDAPAVRDRRQPAGGEPGRACGAAPTGAKALGNAQVVRIGDVAATRRDARDRVTRHRPLRDSRARSTLFSRRRARQAERHHRRSRPPTPRVRDARRGWAANPGTRCCSSVATRSRPTTRDAMRPTSTPQIYVLGPPETISDAVVTALAQARRRDPGRKRRPGPLEPSPSPASATARSAGASSTPATASSSPAPTARSTRPPPRPCRRPAPTGRCCSSRTPTRSTRAVDDTCSTSSRATTRIRCAASTITAGSWGTTKAISRGSAIAHRPPPRDHPRHTSPGFPELTEESEAEHPIAGAPTTRSRSTTSVSSWARRPPTSRCRSATASRA